MIAAWMFYALLVGLLVTLAALAGERVLTLLRKPVRWVWTSALALTLLVPAVSHFVPRRPVMQVPMERAMTVTRDVIAAPIVRIRQEAAASWWPGRQIDRGLLIGWLVVSAGLSQLVLYSMAVLNGRRREWKRQWVDGAEALISPDFGPAVVGWRRLEVVLPAWTLDLAPDARALVLRHEREHVERLDPRLLLYAFFLVIIMPWNPFLWLQFRRLRRAIELDCDARVVRSGVPTARYGEVLLEAVGLCRSAGLPALASFAERAKDLEARIKALTMRTPRWRGLRLALAGGAALVLGTAACVMPDPLSPVLDTPPAQASVKADDLGWVRQHLAGRGPAELVLMVQSFERELLLMELARPAAGRGGRPLLNGVLQRLKSTEIHSISVMKTAALQVPGIKDVILIRLKPGIRAFTQAPAPPTALALASWYSSRPDTMLTLGRYIRQYGGRMQLYFGGRSYVLGRRRGG